MTHLETILAAARTALAAVTDTVGLEQVKARYLGKSGELTELLKQGLNSPLSVEAQVVVLYAGTRGYLDGVAVTDVRRYEADLLTYLDARYSGLMTEIRETGKLDEDALKAALEEFGKDFDVSSEASA